MSKELVISATPHETRVAILEDGQLCEIYVEREKEFALVGSIYKGRVTRVLPGMQSAFVEIGLDSDAFLYVSDFQENLEEFDTVVSSVEGKVQRMEQQGGQVFAPSGASAAATNGPFEAAGEAPAPAASQEGAAPGGEPANGTTMSFEAPAPPSNAEAMPPSLPRSYQGRDRGYGRDRGDRGGRGRRGRWGRRGREDRPPRREFPPSKYVSHPQEPPPPPDYEPIILPGESLAKYRDRVPAAGAANGSIESSVSAEAASAFDQLFQTPAAELPRETETPRAEEAVPEPPREAEAPRAVEEARTEAELPAAAPVESPAPPAAELAASTEVFRASEAAEPEVPSFEAPAPPARTEEGERETPAPTAEAAKSVHAEETREAEPEAAAEPLEAESALAPEEIGLEAAESPDYGAFLDERIAAAEALEEYGEEEEGEIAEAAAEAEEASAAEPEAAPAAGREGELEYSARLQDDRRPRFQRPMRRDRRGGRRGVRGRFHHRPQRPKPTQPITELLKPGQEIIVQIAKEPLGKKGARITSHIALPGRFLVYMPTVDHIGVSRKIASAEERARLRRILLEMKGKYGGGFIVRTAAAGMSEEEVRADVEFLTRTWNEIKQRAEQRKAPAILHRDLNLVERILRDHLSEDYSAIWLDNEEEYAKVVDFVGKFQPRLVNRVKLYTKDVPIFEEFGIQQEIDKSLRPKVWLKSGGYIVINHTEALVAIDVNTGKFVGKGSTRLEDTIVKTNLEAVKEIVRQIRLRDLGGIIVVDFIDMEERKNREKVMQALEEALRSDRAPSKVLGFNEFGLVAITRKRTKQALERVLCQPCPYCTGSGMVKSIPTICYEIQAEARKMAPEIDSPSLTLRVNPEIGKALKTRESVLIEELEKWTKKSVIIQSDPSLHWEQYDIY